MITKNIKAYINSNNIQLSEDINLYSGDGDILINIQLVGLSYNIDNAYSDIKIVKPDTEELILNRKLLNNNLIEMIFTKDMIDELKEIGEYQLQIRLWDSLEGGNRIALPSFYFTVNSELKGDITVLRLATTEDNKGILTEDGKVILL